ncbi:hypothetical protein KY340_01790 [Candidatus Woesearchaeota archaeon]|nr:hypothetical protein [Candidatus Woesearchaeota archaeon]
MAITKKIATIGIKREPGFLYFIDKNGNVCCTLAKKFKSQKEKGIDIVANAKISKKQGCMYYVDKDGDVCEVQMSRNGAKKKKRTEKAKADIKYIVYEQNGKMRLFRSKKLFLAENGRNFEISEPVIENKQYGVWLTYEAKRSTRYKKTKKFVKLAKPAKNIRLVNKIPKKYSY